MTNIAITLVAKAMEGLPAQDPQVTVEVFQVNPLQMPINRTVITNFNGTVTVNVPFVDDDTFPTWQVNVTFSRFDVSSGFMFQPRGTQTPKFLMKVARLPGKWTPDFTDLVGLPSPRFDRLKDVLGVSGDVDLKGGEPVGDLNAKYDSLSGQAQTLGKMALLNLYSVLTDERDPLALVEWFSHVNEIVLIDQERFVAVTTVNLFENVSAIVKNLSGVFAAQGYSTESSLDFKLHIPNIPARYDAAHNLKGMVTVKKKYEQGDVQLTVSQLEVGGATVYLLDCDMDEHENIQHFFDLLSHLVNGGTSPIVIHDYIEQDSAMAAVNHVATVDLGYKLV